ncbi:hypothetical protein OEZ86_005158 [Tetradesmus obliquus]|nr:hypothetical protein OEZ86_005158 [Tetradesmus obliquus]
MESTNRTGYKCRICKKPDPPNARNAACNEDETIDWWQCGACTGWYHEVCLDDPQHALGDAWCPQCEQRSAEDFIGLGDFGQHGATRLNYTLQGVGEDVLACINAANLIGRHLGAGSSQAWSLRWCDSCWMSATVSAGCWDHLALA